MEFIDAFPEALTWKVTLVDRQKKAVFSKPSMPAAELKKSLQDLLNHKGTHFFIRPNHPLSVFVDLDKIEPAPV
jgi:hypothetical protein